METYCWLTLPVADCRVAAQSLWVQAAGPSRATAGPGKTLTRGPIPHSVCLEIETPKTSTASTGRKRGERCPLTIPLGVQGSVVSSPSGVRGWAPAENRHYAYFRSKEAIWNTIFSIFERRRGPGKLSPLSPPLDGPGRQWPKNGLTAQFQWRKRVRGVYTRWHAIQIDVLLNLTLPNNHNHDYCHYYDYDSYHNYYYYDCCDYGCCCDCFCYHHTNNPPLPPPRWPTPPSPEPPPLIHAVILLIHESFVVLLVPPPLSPPPLPVLILVLSLLIPPLLLLLLAFRHFSSSNPGYSCRPKVNFLELLARLYWGWMPFLHPPNQQHQSTEGLCPSLLYIIDCGCCQDREVHRTTLRITFTRRCSRLAAA